MQSGVRRRATVTAMLLAEVVALAWLVGDDVLHGLDLLGPPAEDVQAFLSPVIVLPALVAMAAAATGAAWLITVHPLIRAPGRAALRFVSLLHLFVIAYLVAVSTVGFSWRHVPTTVGLCLLSACGAYVAWVATRFDAPADDRQHR